MITNHTKRMESYPEIRIKVSAGFKGQQTTERLTDVIFEALNKCEHIQPIPGSVKVRETLVSQVRYKLWRRKRIIQKGTRKLGLGKAALDMLKSPAIWYFLLRLLGAFLKRGK